MVFNRNHDTHDTGEGFEPEIDRDEDDRDDEDDFGDDRPGLLGAMREGCVLGDRCLCPHIYHSSDECFDLEMAEAFYQDVNEPEWRRG